MDYVGSVTGPMPSPIPTSLYVRFFYHFTSFRPILAGEFWSPDVLVGQLERFQSRSAITCLSCMNEAPLVFDLDTLAKIYLGLITTWDDPAIKQYSLRSCSP